MEARVVESDRLASQLEETEANFFEALTMHVEVLEEISQAKGASEILEVKLNSLEADRIILLAELGATETKKEEAKESLKNTVDL